MSGIKIHFCYLVSADCTTASSASEKNGLSKGIRMINKTVYIRLEPWKLTACLRTTHSFLNWKSKSTIMLWQCLTSTHSLHGIGSFHFRYHVCSTSLPLPGIIGKENKMHFNWVSMNSARKYQLGTLFLRLQLETRQSFYVVIPATRRSSRLQCKGSTFISQLF